MLVAFEQAISDVIVGIEVFSRVQYNLKLSVFCDNAVTSKVESQEGLLC
jgi:hypothetical protein